MNKPRDHTFRLGKRSLRMAMVAHVILLWNSMKGKQVYLVVALVLLVSASGQTSAQQISEVQHQAIEKRFPDARITEVEETRWQGETVLEVDLISGDGTEYEIILSEVGVILSVVEEGYEGGAPLIGGELSIGLAVRSERETYRGMKKKIEFMPFLFYQNGPFEILNVDKLGAAIKLYESGTISLRLNGSVEVGEGYRVKDSDFYEGMEELGTSYGLGVKLGFEFHDWEASFDFYQDISREHNGRESGCSLLWSTDLTGILIRPGLSITWMDRKIVEYLYGVSKKEARTNRPAYAPKATYKAEASLLLLHPISDRLAAVGHADATACGSEISNSPLVDEDYEIAGSLGLMYSF